jgi:hypothetical protein
LSIYVRKFKKEDLSAFKPLEPGLSQFDDELAQSIENSSLAITGVRDGRIVGCGGVHPNKEQGEVWLRLSKICLKHKLDTLRWLREGLKIIEDTFGFKQLNATIKCDFPQSIKLVKSLGFKQTRTRTINGVQWDIFSKRVEE